MYIEVKEGMAVEDPSSPYGLRLVIDDYPYAVDGLEIWSYYVSLYYPTEDAVKKLSEVHAWWNEAVEKGQDDLKDKPWWPKSDSHLQHYHMQSSEGLFENNYKKDRGPCGPNSMLLMNSTSDKGAIQIGLITIKAIQPFKKFEKKLKEIEDRISGRNKNSSIRNRTGPGQMPYAVLLPTRVKGLFNRSQKVKGTVVLMRKNVLDINSITSVRGLIGTGINIIGSTIDGLTSFLGRSVCLQLISATKADGNGNGVVGKKTYLEGIITSIPTLGAGQSAFTIHFEWDADMGIPGAFLIKNYMQVELFLVSLTLEDIPNQGSMHFVCNSWVYNSKVYEKDRIFFASETYVPSETPGPLVTYREAELQALRGNGTGKRKEWDRVYDYDVYNDLGNPDSGENYARPVLGGSLTHPYPRRGRTGRKPTKKDPNSEKPGEAYIPRDENFGHLKSSDFLTYGLKSLTRSFLPALKTVFDINFTPNEFDSFEEVRALCEGGIKLPTDILSKISPLPVLKEIFRTDGESVLKFSVPDLIKVSKSAWMTDEEFAREMIAGVNPCVIRRLQEFPPQSKLDPSVYGDQTSKMTIDHLEINLEGLTAIKDQRLFILDHHDTFMPFLRRIDESKSSKAYATRTILFLKDDGTLKPLAIELSLPHPGQQQLGAYSKVILPANQGVESTIWLLAKAHVIVNDSLNTHAVIEPFVIATNRNLSILHPIYKLLFPHYRDTMNINALARQSLINADGFIEKTFLGGKYAVEISSSGYKNWVFLDQALPADLIKRKKIKNFLNKTFQHKAFCNKRLFILDYYDAFMPYLRKINELDSAKAYATRTFLFLKDDGTLKPLAIELSKPHQCVYVLPHPPHMRPSPFLHYYFPSQVVLPADKGDDVMEPFSIATHRQLSVLHPIYKLLHPHFRDTININALARQSLINAGSIIEQTFLPGKYSMEMSSAVYKNWVFTDQALPTDLIKRVLEKVVQQKPEGEGEVVLMRKNVLDFNNLTSVVGIVGTSKSLIGSAVDGVTSLMGKSVCIQLISATKADANGNGIVGKKAYLEGIIASIPTLGAGQSAFNINFKWDSDMGIPGAFIITNHMNVEFFLVSLTLEDIPNQGTMNFVCNSWVYNYEDYKQNRIFFVNETYLPSATPGPLVKYREEELKILRGDGTGERKEHERIYDYDVYNDLGNPDEDVKLARPVLGGSSTYPYPRRVRTGRKATKKDPKSERPASELYMPRDEKFGHLKSSDFLTYGIKSLSQKLLPSLENVFDSDLTWNEFDSFEEVRDLYEGGIKVPTGVLSDISPIPIFKEIFRTDGESVLQFPPPHVVQVTKSAWMTDDEFAREMIAGVNPNVIRLLKEFPPQSKLDPSLYGDQSSTITKEHLEINMDGVTVEEALNGQRLFILDYQDAFMPYLTRINALPSAKAYATRTILFLKDDGTLKPLAIELSKPHPSGDNLGAESKVTKVLKAQFGYWPRLMLNTHAVTEPFIIATNRRLSVLHPIYKLLYPHYRDTININGLARNALINAGGVIEESFLPGRYSIEMSSAVYKNWVFTDQALPVDLIKRGMAVEDPSSPHGLRLAVEDYPYAVDGLEIWDAIKSWVQEYVSLYYPTDLAIQQDTELQAWWKEVVEKGHGDLKDKPWWPKMQTRQELIQSCSTIIWIASALHAAVNFGQYPYGGFILNRPTLSRRWIPEPGTKEYDEMVESPQTAYLRTITPKRQTIIDLTVIEILSRHASDEIYLGERDNPNWTSDSKALEAFKKFGSKLAEIEGKITARNKDSNKKNRYGPVQLPYTLLLPTSEEGLTFRGIPNSISI
ncbi:Seed linoleate 9S-lipoxygenase [Glycine soja]